MGRPFGIRVRRTIALPPQDCFGERGIPITSPARTLLDFASIAPRGLLRRAVRQAQATHRVNLREIAEVLTRFRRRKGAPALAELVARGPAPTRSELEDIVLDLLLHGGLEHPDVNTPLRLEGRTVVPDFRWPAQRLVVEADGAQWHSGMLAEEDDAERQAALEAFGERVVRVTWTQAVTRQAQTIARVKQAGAPSR